MNKDRFIVTANHSNASATLSFFYAIIANSSFIAN